MTKDNSSNKVAIIVAIITSVASIIAAIVTGIFGLRAVQMQKEAESTSSAMQIIATQGGETQVVLEATANAPTSLPYPTYTPYPTNTAPAIPSLTPTKSKTILFEDDFNGGIRPEWEIAFGNWIMSNGEFSLSQIEEIDITNNKEKWSYGTAIVGDSNWQDYTVKAKINLQDESGNCGSILIRVQDSENFLAWEYCYFYNFTAHTNNMASWYLVQDGKWTEIPNTQTKDFPVDKQFTIEVIVKNDVVQSFINKELVNSFSGFPFATGKIGLRIQSNSISHTLSFDNVVVDTTLP
ncbi:MAG TPA: hypothetical protein DIS90_01240 [Cytophagales bacterium]|nr:hypothetical protein [Cytophagales bacterium]